MYTILAINPGSTSTKIAFFQDASALFTETLHHSAESLRDFNTIYSQFDFRQKSIQEVLQQKAVDMAAIDAYVGRGGLLNPIPSGTYLVEESMICQLQSGVIGEHASNLGAILAHKLAVNPRSTCLYCRSSGSR